MNILNEAEILVSQDRQAAYGDSPKKYDAIARLWSVILQQPVTPEQVVLCMLLIKIARESKKHQRDNLVDIAGYALILEQVRSGKTSLNDL